MSTCEIFVTSFVLIIHVQLGCTCHAKKQKSKPAKQESKLCISHTGGNSRRLVKSYSRYDVRKYCFTQRIVNIWNSLPEYVVNSSSENSFKNYLDKFWASQEVYYNFKCDTTGTGNRSLCQLE